MKCPKCNSDVAPSLLHLPFGSHMVELHCYKCPSGHLFSTSQQLNSAERREAPSLELKRKISVSGNSLIVRIPVDLASHLKLSEGDDVALRISGEKSFVVEKV